MEPPPRDERISPTLASWLVDEPGLAAIARAHALVESGREPLELALALREDGLNQDQVAAVASAAHARSRMDPDFRDRGFVATQGMLEQTSHRAVASWRAARFDGADDAVDLCSGAGSDAIAIAARVGRVLAVDVDEARVIVARHNSRSAGGRVDNVVGDALRPPARLDGLVHADPSRRTRRGRARRLAEYSPPVGALTAATKGAEGRGIVVSPGVDLDDPDLPAGEIEFIQFAGDLVEAIVWTGALRQGERLASATLLPEGVSRGRDRADEHLPTGPPGEWLVSVAPAAVRARLHDALGAEIGARRLADHRALLTTDERPPESPWWTQRLIEAVLPVRPGKIRAWLRGADDQHVEIFTHGYATDLQAFWRDLGRPRRGSGGREIHLVRLDDGAIALVCRR